jgi:hypothetical protein
VDTIGVFGFVEADISKGLIELINDTEDPLLIIPVSSKNLLAKQTLAIARQKSVPFNAVVDVLDETTEDFVQGALQTILTKDIHATVVLYSGTVALAWADSDDDNRIYKMALEKDLEVWDINDGLVEITDGRATDDDDEELDEEEDFTEAIRSFAQALTAHIVDKVVEEVEDIIEETLKDKRG